MGDLLIMSKRERKRKVILEEVMKGVLSLVDAAPRMEVCYRQAKRIYRSYRYKGDAGLIHKGRGKKSSHSYSQDFKDLVLNLYESRYMDFGPTFASEKLLEYEDIKINPETLRLWLLEAELWYRHRKRKCYRQRRERRHRFGELLQIDGSDHHWFGKEHPRCCLLNIVDDATSNTMSQLDHGETCKVLLTTFLWWIKLYGVPKSVYVDLKNLYVGSPKVDGEIAATMNVFGRVCYLLNVKIIKAYSPQAKGRVERNHGIYQDRFVKELKLRGITTIDAANKFLQESYLNEINCKFAKQPVLAEDAHCPAKAYGNLEQIFCWEYSRQIRNDFTISFNNKFYQFTKDQQVRLQPKKKVIVHVHLDDGITFWYKGSKLKYKQIEQPKKQEKVKLGINSSLHSKLSRANKHKSPWNTFNPEWLKNKTRSIAHA